MDRMILKLIDKIILINNNHLFLFLLISLGSQSLVSSINYYCLNVYFCILSGVAVDLNKEDGSKE